ncbi:MAG: peptidylprolyl isomerase [Cyanobacteria bacterium REEB67]|nr:peptidylprolyl isomerase [Cyanobacteria bacterium REEB67]
MPDPIVSIETNKGVIKVEVFQKDAPITAENFLDLVNKGFYNGLSFHRYEPGFVIQGGCPNGTGTGDYKDPATGKKRTIQLEKKPNLKHNEAGMVAMARSNDPNSASCQYYITLAPAGFIDNPPGYAVFGKVVEGLENALALRAGDKMTKVSVLETANK